MPDTQILPQANALLACLCEQLALNPDPPANCCLRAGDSVIHDANAESSLDTVCCPGTAYVRIGAKYPSSNFPAPDGEAVKRNNCMPTSFAVELVMGVIRCIPGIGTSAGPDCADWTLAATHDANDLQALGSALCCWSSQLAPGKLWLAGTSTVQMTADCIERQQPVLMSVGKCC